MFYFGIIGRFGGASSYDAVRPDFSRRFWRINLVVTESFDFELKK